MTFLALLFPVSVYGQTHAAPQNNAQVQLSFAPLVREVSPAVVNVYTKRSVVAGGGSPFMGDPFFGKFFDRDFFGGQMRQHLESALGSGVIVTGNGLVVTNAHVIRGADEVSVGLKDGNEYVADIVLQDEASDLALLRIKQEDDEAPFPYVTLKPSESLEVGDLVLAIGNPFGVGQTVTSGIISAKGRSSLDINDYNFFIQTDAAINPGNSGGPLVAMDGKVVGINTAIYSRSGGSMGIGFAIPSEMVASVIAAEVNGQVSNNGILRPWLGVSVQDITSDIATSLELDKPEGALVSDVHSASPFIASGLETGDVIIGVNDRKVRNSAELKFIIATVPIGRQANVSVWRNGKVLSMQVEAMAPPNDPPRNDTVLQGNHILKGAVVANFNPAVSVELGLSGDEHGVVVVQAPRGFFARTVKAGDILTQINGHEIDDVEQVDDVLSQGKGQGIEMLINRQGRLVKMFLR